jgi:uncharacterized membrane protein
MLAVSTAVWVFILIPVLVIWVAGLVDIVRRDLPRSTKAGWIIVVLLLPVIGTLVYFLIRKPTEEERRKAGQAATSREAVPERARRRLPGE